MRSPLRLEIHVKHFEFWPPRIFEAPYYLWLGLLCLRYRFSIASLAKANSALDHGEIGIGSKMQTQLAFPQEWFPRTVLIASKASLDTRLTQMRNLAKQVGWPLVMKPDIGAVGKGVLLLRSDDELLATLPRLQGDYMAQQYCALPEEFGVFFVRTHGRARISGVNRKHFPTVDGDGVHTVAELAKRHPRYTHHWKLFLRYNDVSKVPAAGESLRLSFIGSHTMGCKFTDDTHLATDALCAAVERACGVQPGFNFGRLDVRAASQEALQAGEFMVIEVNGVASLPTHMFDPNNSLWRAYRIFFAHGALLARAAHEHRNVAMPLLPLREIWQRNLANQQQLNNMHNGALSLDPLATTSSVTDS